MLGERRLDHSSWAAFLSLAAQPSSGIPQNLTRFHKKDVDGNTDVIVLLFGGALGDAVACAYPKNAIRACAQARAWTKLRPFQGSHKPITTVPLFTVLCSLLVTFMVFILRLQRIL
jgi:hypothetical protein